MLSVNAACRIEGLHFFFGRCGIAVLLFLFLHAAFLFAALCGASCYVRSVLWLIVFFSLCERIFNCCLRSFAPAGATSPFQSQRAGPQRFLVWVRVWRCCSLEICQVMTSKTAHFTNKTQSPLCADTALHSNLWVINKIGSVFSLFFITRYFPFLLHIPHFHVKIILL